MFGFTVERLPREEGGFCAPKSDSKNTVSNVGRALDVCLIIIYALNLIIVLRRLIKRSQTESAADYAD
jgi:hypothetical protein